MLALRSHIGSYPAAAPGSTSLKKKICMVGLAGVGKTSLVRRYVMSLFSESYFSGSSEEIVGRLRFRQLAK
jgi:GTPase SAR1 family protein